MAQEESPNYKCLQFGVWVQQNVTGLRQAIEEEGEPFGASPGEASPPEEESTKASEWFEAMLGELQEAEQSLDCNVSPGFIREKVEAAKEAYEAGDPQAAIESLKEIDNQYEFTGGSEEGAPPSDAEP